MIDAWRRARGYLRQSVALRPLTEFLEHMRSLGRGHCSYGRWIELCESPNNSKTHILDLISDFVYRPTLSVITALSAYGSVEFLSNAVESVRAQYYEKWELCIAVDPSMNNQVHSYLESKSQQDKRIRVSRLPEVSGTAGALNQALRLATGEFVALLGHEDELSPNALFEVVHLLQRHPDADMIYSDEDKIGPDGVRSEPFFKPDWSPEYLLSCMYTSHLDLYRRELLEGVGGFRVGFDACQNYDIALRISEQTRRIYHVPKIIYHRREIPHSARNASASADLHLLGKRALVEHLARRGTRAHVLDGTSPGHYRVEYEVDIPGKVSIIIPTRDQKGLLAKCITSIEQRTGYRNFEIIVVDNNSSEAESTRYLSRLTHKVIPFPGVFNFSRMVNFAVKHSEGEYLLLLNNDTEVISANWMESLIGYCQQREIGVAGAKLLFGNHSIQHAGVVLGMGYGGVAGHPLRGFHENTPRLQGFASDARNCSAVTAACMMFRRNVFQQVGGFDENLPVAYNDVDFCLRVREAGYRTVYVPQAELYHYESASRGHKFDVQEIAYFRERWGTLLRNDPFYNPNLTLKSEDLGYCLSRYH